MVSEVTSDVFGNPVTLRLGTPLATGHLTMSVLGTNGKAWSQVFAYDQVSMVMETDTDKLMNVVGSHPSKTGFALGILIGISDVVVGVINGIAGFIKGILGSFVGVGLIGIMFVLMMVALSLMVSVYAFVVAAPVLAVSFGLRHYKRNLLKAEGEKLQRAAMGLFNGTVAVVSPQDAPNAIEAATV